MNYTIPQLEGLAQAIADNNKELDAETNGRELTGDAALKALEAQGLI